MPAKGADSASWPSRAALRAGLQIGAAGNVFPSCSLRRARYRCGGGGGNGSLMVASALHCCASSSDGLFYLASKHDSPLGFHIRGRPPRCQGNDSMAYVSGRLEESHASAQEEELRRIEGKKMELQKEVDGLTKLTVLLSSPNPGTSPSASTASSGSGSPLPLSSVSPSTTSPSASGLGPG